MAPRFSHFQRLGALFLVAALIILPSAFASA
jgi:hypothetical protein